MIRIILSSLVIVIGGWTEHSAWATDEVPNNRLELLKGAVFDNPYQQLPHYKVNRKLFGKSNPPSSNKLRLAAQRTLNDERDLIEFPDGQKLLQANGICYSGLWSIDTQSNFTGLFANNVLSPIIARISVSFNGTRQKNKRSLGMAIKLLPNDLGDRPSLNVFVMHTIGGVITQHTLDLSMDNEPPLGNLPRWGDLGTALRLRRDFEKIDKDNITQNNGEPIKPRVNYRPVSHLANHLNNTNDDTGVRVSPKWLRLSPLTAQRVDKDDFREELNVNHYANNTIKYKIEVAADNGKKKSTAIWQRIGELHLTKSVTSASCDTQLHFKHPKLGNP